MQRGSDKHGPIHDDELARETRGLGAGGPHEPRAEEWREQEPSGEDQPDVDLAPDTDLVGGTPPGMDQRDVSTRSELARHLGRAVYPADRDALLGRLAESSAPDAVVAMVQRLPAGTRYGNVREVAEALGLHGEAHRF